MISPRSRQTSLLFFFFLFLFPLSDAMSQNRPIGDLSKKRLPGTILGRRTLILHAPFNATRALRKLFPASWYDLSASMGYTNRVINWTCPNCKPVFFEDVNFEDSNKFP